MDALILPLGSLGDVHPFVGLGQRLRERGHDVTVVANESFAGLIERAGLGFAEAGSRAELDAAFGDRAFWHPYDSYRAVIDRVILPAMRAQLEVVTRLHRPGRTVLVAGTSSLGARIAHDKLGVPLATVHVQPMVLWSEYVSPVVGPLWLGDRVPRLLKRLQYRLAEILTVDRWMLDRANGLRAELGLGPLGSMTELLNSPQKVIGLFPEWFAARQPDWPPQMELVDFALWDDAEIDDAPPELEAFLAAGSPPIAFTISSTEWRSTEFFAAAVGACRRLGRRGVLLAGKCAEVPSELPKEVVRFEYVPFRHLLSRVAALVHHGGLNTAAQALAAGVPQLARPACFDQPDNAERLRRLGVSETLRPGEFNEESVSAALERLLGSPEVARRCAELAHLVRRGPGLDRACEIIESLAPKPEARRASARPHRPEMKRIVSG